MKSLEDLLCTEIIWIGAHSIIYRAINPATSGIYAVKEVDCSELSDDSIYFHMLRQEGPLLDSLEHPNIVSPVMHSIDYEDRVLWMVLPLYKYGSLFNVLDQFRKSGTVPPVQFVYSVIGSISRAFQYLHTSAVIGEHIGILHRNLTSKSIFLADNGTILLSGFDFACPLTLLADEEQLRIYGNKAYAPPELENGALTVASDIWALGCLVYEMCTCSLLFVDAVQESKQKGGFHASDIVLQSPELSQLCQRMLVINPAERITVDEILANEYVCNVPETISNLLPVSNPLPCVS